MLHLFIMRVMLHFCILLVLLPISFVIVILDCVNIMDFSGSYAFACVVGDLYTGRSTVLLNCLIKL